VTQLVEVAAGQRRNAGPVGAWATALAGLEVHEHSTGDEFGVSVEISAAAERHPGGQRPGRQRREQPVESKVAHGDQVGDLVIVGQREQFPGRAGGVQAHQSGPSTDGARYNSTSSARRSRRGPTTGHCDR
jgi:hypothetical protein